MKPLSAELKAYPKPRIIGYHKQWDEETKRKAIAFWRRDYGHFNHELYMKIVTLKMMQKV